MRISLLGFLFLTWNVGVGFGAEAPASAAPGEAATPDEPPAGAQPDPLHSETPAAKTVPTITTLPKPPDPNAATAPVQEKRVVTRGTASVAGASIPYAATAGTLTIRDNEGKPAASMFYVAYVADRAPKGAQRPVTFFYNGGPGSASLWLHLGTFGPKRVHTDSPEATHNAPYDFEPNEQCLLDKTDLVFLDAIGAGYSRPLGDGKGDKFWGVDGDIDAFARAITRYISVTHRWNSPKFIFGESYGTTRSAGLAYALQEQGVQCNGVMLLSSILNYGIRSAGFDRPYVAYVPSFAAAAWYHGKIPNKAADLAKFLDEVRGWAAGPYSTALEKGTDLTPAETDAVARQLAAYTGLSVKFVMENRLRVSLARFRKELLRDDHRTIGRYDSRFKGIDADDGADVPEFDAAAVGPKGAYVGILNDYLETELHYPSELLYLPSGADINRRWDWHHKEPNSSGGGLGATQPDVALDLSAAMRENPHLKVFSLNGWYDMATPFFQTEYDLKHMELDPALRANLRFAYYPSGHMVYLNPDALKQLRADVGRFYDDCLK